MAKRVAANTLSAKSHNNIVGVLKVCLDWAVAENTLGLNPMPNKRLRAKVVRDERAIVQGAEIARLWSATAHQDQLIVALALFAGLRRGDIFGARWSDVVWPFVSASRSYSVRS